MAVDGGARESLATLFVLGGRTWVIATGDAVARAREALAHPRDHVRTLLSWADDGTGAPLREGEEIARVDLPGGALRSRDRRLVDGALAPLGRTLERASVSLLPGTEGVIVVHLAYPAAEDAGAAAARAQEVVDAFRRGLIGSADAKDEKPSGAARGQDRDGSRAAAPPLAGDDGQGGARRTASEPARAGRPPTEARPRPPGRAPLTPVRPYAS